MKKISVCIATYNGSRYIIEQLTSILRQLDENDEVIIADDGSTDDTVECIYALNDKRIKLYHNSFKNPIKNFEFALEHSNGEIVFLSDQDDVWLNDKVRIMTKELEGNDVVVSNCYIGDDDLKIIKESYFEWRNSKKGLIKNLWRNSYLGCCMCFDRKIFNKLLPFPENIPMHDMWIGMVAEIYYKSKFIDDKLMIYRRHSNNATFLDSNFKSKETLFTRIMFRANLLYSIIMRIFRF